MILKETFSVSYALLLLLSMVDNRMAENDLTQEKATGEAVVEAVAKYIRDAGIFADDHGFLKRIACVESKYGNDPNTFKPKNDKPYYGGIWQVDKIGFDETKNVRSHPSLRTTMEKIKKQKGIDWNSVTWEDLWKPLYSGLSARLLLSTKAGKIPDTLEGQAEYWKKHYNSGVGKGTPEKFIKDVKACEGK